MGKIAVLPDTLCNQIAAGEVVERPAAVVKELVENAIDAGGRRISVAVLQGGRREVRVLDNGTGMAQEDALLSIERHATSKIRSSSDLQSIQSLGFRGEALPSIAAVSRFELTTREPSAVSGTQIIVEGGVLKKVKEVGCPAGTQVVVRDLFFNLPARRKFLRTVETETAYINDQFLRLAMPHPDIHFQLAHQDRVLYDFPQARSLAARVGQVLGGDIHARLRPISFENGALRTDGLLSPPDIHRATGQSIFAYVNGRSVRDRTLHHAILSGYETLLPKGKFPVVVLFLELDPLLVDVNVHPTKREVRFRSPGEVLDAVRAAVRTALTGMPSAPVATARPEAPPAYRRSVWSKPASFLEPQTPLAETSARAGIPDTPLPPQQSIFPVPLAPFRRPEPQERSSPIAPVDADGPEARSERFFSRLPVLGQLANTYILLEAPDGLVLVDQHAAHERILFDALSSRTERKPAQRLLRSVVLDLLPTQAVKLNRWMARLAEIGFEIEPFGGDSFVIHAVPAALSHHSPDVVVRELIETGHEEDSRPSWDLVASLAKSASCHDAIKAGDRLHPESIRHLLESLDRTDVSATCPHGRPVWVKLSLRDIERLFLRT
ncbi:MAG: DNA mismatch repair endonuclease MutL [Syntrophobacteraceae bacterium]